MRKLLGAILAIVLLAVAPASAKVAAPVQGSFKVSIAEETVEAQPLAGGNCLITLTATFTFTGTLQGSFTAPFAILHDGACNEPAAETFVSYGTFSGDVVLGGTKRTGTFDFAFAGTIDAASNARGTLVVLRGTEGLERLRGTLELTGISGIGGTYRGALSA